MIMAPDMESGSLCKMNKNEVYVFFGKGKCLAAKNKRMCGIGKWYTEFGEADRVIIRRTGELIGCMISLNVS